MGALVRRAGVHRAPARGGQDHRAARRGPRSVGVEVVTLWMLSTDNLKRPARTSWTSSSRSSPTPSATSRRRDGGGSRSWATSTCSPEDAAAELRDAEVRTAGVPGLHVNVAIGYGGRHEIVDAVRSLLREHARRGTSLEELAEIVAVDHIAEHLYTQRAARPGPRHPHVRGAAARRLPALAERALGVLLLRGVLARLPAGGLPAGAARLRGAGASARALTRRPGGGCRHRRAGGVNSAARRACRAGRAGGPA